ncbi:MAG: hypothetical protein SGJ27_05930 [Candidatus Melainabacteria bacterium]|nr:hypothetical protein [Candidatus Melainabacteria bacterium]
MMSETKMLAVAFCLSMAMSLIAAGAFYFMGTGPFAVVIGGTLVGITAYVGTCVHCSPFVLAPVPVPFEEDEHHV